MHWRRCLKRWAGHFTFRVQRFYFDHVLLRRFEEMGWGYSFRGCLALPSLGLQPNSAQCCRAPAGAGQGQDVQCSVICFACIGLSTSCCASCRIRPHQQH